MPAAGKRRRRRRSPPDAAAAVAAPAARAGGAGRGGGRQGQEARNRADRDWEVRVPVKAGRARRAGGVRQESDAIAETARLPFLRPYPAGVNIAETRTGAYLRSVEIAGPFDPTGPGNSPSRQRIFICTPIG